MSTTKIPIKMLEQQAFLAADELRNNENLSPHQKKERAKFIVDNLYQVPKRKNIMDLQVFSENIVIASKYFTEKNEKLNKCMGIMYESFYDSASRNPIQTVSLAAKLAKDSFDTKSDFFKMTVSLIRPFVKDEALLKDKETRKFFYRTTQSLANKAIKDGKSSSEIIFLYKDVVTVCSRKVKDKRVTFFDDSIDVVKSIQSNTPIEFIMLENALFIVDKFLHKKNQTNEDKEILQYFSDNLRVLEDKVPEHLKDRILCRREKIYQKSFEQ